MYSPMDVSKAIKIHQHLPIGSLLKLFVLNDLNPIVVRIKNKCHILHSAISQSLLPIDALFLKALASSLKIVY